MNRITVSISDGRLKGIIEEDVYGNQYVAFRGIPYAKPPIGELRFKDPVPAEPWNDIRDASKYGNMAVQPNLMTHKIMGDEDCLYLNVFTNDINPLVKRAVMVWIHGGGFFTGSGDATFYGPDYIVEKDVVLVTLNYRLSALGFLNLYHEVAAGNQGLKDVILALKWVQKNISNFGGDSAKITIFGESAGAVIVHYMTLTPLCEGLFQRAIFESGAVTCGWAFTEPEPPATNKSFLLAKRFGKDTEDPEVAYEFLKTIDAKELINMAHNVLPAKEDYIKFVIPFTPTLDHQSPNPVIPGDLEAFINRGIKVETLFGFNRNEGIFLLNSAFVENMDEKNLSQVDADFKLAILPRVLATLPNIPITLSQLRYLYFGDKAISNMTLLNYGHFLTDEYFVRGMMQAANIQMKNKDSGKTYLYKFAYKNKNNLMRKILRIDLPGVSHIEELSYLFNHEIITPLKLPFPKSDSEYYMMIKRITQMWTDFAKTGDPTPAITDLTPIKWTPLKREGKVYDYMNIKSTLQMKTFRKGKPRWDWENAIHKQ